MTAFESQNLTELIDALAAATPAPAGGSAAAVTAAQGAALLAMAADITRARGARTPVADADLAAMSRQARVHAHALLGLAKADGDAFLALLAARRAPDAGPQTPARAQRAVIDVPLAVCRICLELLQQAGALAPVYRASVAPDAWAGVQLIMAGARISLANAQLNVRAEGDAPDSTGQTDGSRAIDVVIQTAASLDGVWAATEAAFAALRAEERW